MSRLLSLKGGTSAFHLKKSQDDLQIGDNIFVRRSIANKEEIYIATIVEVKRVRDFSKMQTNKTEPEKVDNDQLARGLNITFFFLLFC